MKPYRAELEEALEAMREMLAVIGSAGLSNLANGVQLGPTVWYVKASDAIACTNSAIASAEESLRRPEQEHVAWCRYVFRHEKPTRIVLCDSDAKGAFKVYASPPEPEKPEARRLTGEEAERILERHAGGCEWTDDQRDSAATLVRSTESALASLWGVKLP